MADLRHLIDAYEAAHTAYERNRLDRLTYAATDRARAIQAEQQSKSLVAVMRLAQDALCQYLVQHRNELGL